MPTVKNLHVQAHVELNEKAITGKDVVLCVCFSDDGEVSLALLRRL